MSRRSKWRVARWLCAAFAAAGMAGVVAAEPPLPAHASFTIDSVVLKEVRRINVYTPPGYDRESRAGYPVLYMPDGGLQEDFPHVASDVDAAVRAGEMRPMIVVGIENTERRRDMTGPTKVASDREIVQRIDQEFARLLESLKDLASSVPINLLYRNPPAISMGECILRSAAKIEQTCGGLTSNLWDDPFEWTLPEKLSLRTDITRYLDEVEETRIRGFAFIASDSALSTEIPAPETLLPLNTILLDTLVSASHYQGRAFAVFQMLSDEKLPRL